jgi:hypothetical protein
MFLFACHVHSSLYWIFQEIERWWVCYVHGSSKKSCFARVHLRASFQDAPVCFVTMMGLRYLWLQRFAQNWRKDCTGILSTSALSFIRLLVFLRQDIYIICNVVFKADRTTLLCWCLWLVCNYGDKETLRCLTLALKPMPIHSILQARASRPFSTVQKSIQ